MASDGQSKAEPAVGEVTVVIPSVAATVADHDADDVWRLEGSPVLRRTVLIVDDHEAFREAARSLLEAEGFDVVGETGGGHAALMAAETLRPDVVLLDIQLPDLDGFAVADGLASQPSPPAVVLISSRDAETYGARLAHAPARGFLAKRDLSGAALAELLA